MSQDTLLPVLGRCPLCEGQLHAESLLAAYSDGESWPRMLAECSLCDEVVAPV